MKSKTYPKPSQLTQSKLSSVLAAHETVVAATEALDTSPDAIDAFDFESHVQELVEEANNIADEYEQADEDMGGHQGINYERAEALREIEFLANSEAPEKPEQGDDAEVWEQDVADYWENVAEAVSELNPYNVWPD